MPYPRKPAALKARQGNPGRRPLGRDIDGAVLAKVPTCPAWLDDEARKFFRNMGRECIGMGLLTAADVPALIALAVTWGQWVTAQREVKARGAVLTTASGAEVLSPWLTVANRALDKFCDLLAQFGGTPASRTRFVLQNREEPLDLRALLLGQAAEKIAAEGAKYADPRDFLRAATGGPAADEAAELRGLLEG